MKGHAHIIFGPIGAGKSTFSLNLAQKQKAIKFSTDEWFKTLFFDDLDGMPKIEWTFERIARCETQIWRIAQQSLYAGNDVVFDLGLQKVTDRKRIEERCKKIDVEYTFYCLVADKHVRQQRVIERNKGVSETFEFSVSAEMFEIADSMFEQPTESELVHTSYIDTAGNT
jgi:predicted kinase